MCKVCQAEGALLGEVDRVVLENTTPGHSKQYTIWLEETGSCSYIVKARWGPIRGTWEQSQVKTNPLPVGDARNFLQKIKRSKERKGYVERVCRE